jgi:alpha-ribazole phosphatase
MIRLIMVRHGQTTWNKERRYQGQSDTPLDETGVSQAVALASHFAGQAIHSVYSSDLQRAWNTALPIARAVGLQPISEPRLREGSFGDWEGLTYDEINQHWPGELTAWLNDPLTRVPPGGETLQQILARIGAVVEHIRQRHTGQTVMVVSHGGALRAMICYALDLPSPTFWRLSLGSAAVSEMRLHEDVSVLNLFNDTHVVSHIPASPWVGRG